MGLPELPVIDERQRGVLGRAGSEINSSDEMGAMRVLHKQKAISEKFVILCCGNWGVAMEGGHQRETHPVLDPALRMGPYSNCFSSLSLFPYL